MKHELNNKLISSFQAFLRSEEKTPSTIEKYIRDLLFFRKWTNKRNIDKNNVLEYKEYLKGKYKTSSINSMLSSINSFFDFADWKECKVKTIKMQKNLFRDEDRELTKQEYKKLLKCAANKKQHRLFCIIQTLGATGIRISELEYITVESVMSGVGVVNSKGKYRTIMLPRDLCANLKKYLKMQKIYKGSIFVTKSGRPVDRSNIWNQLQKLCDEAGVEKRKVFPHNFRHLFARVYYSTQKDIVRLADILGHTSINTTRIYTIESGKVHREQIQKLGLVLKM